MTQEKETEEKAALRVYEVGYLVSPLVAESTVGEVVSQIKMSLEKQGAFVISDDFPKSRQLAYTLTKPLGGKNEKYSSAYFGWVKFEAGAASVSGIEADLVREGRIIRFLIVKTEREAHVPAKAFFRRPETVRREIPKTAHTAPVAGMTEAELDKTIAELVVE